MFMPVIRLVSFVHRTLVLAVATAASLANENVFAYPDVSYPACRDSAGIIR
jgi:hypothetical protein